MDAWQPLKRIRSPTVLLCAGVTIALLLGASTTRGAGSVPLSEIPPRAYLVATDDGSTLRLYLNAVLVAHAQVPGPVDRTTAPLEIGSYAGHAIWSGAIDEVAVYARALSPGLIVARYKLGVDSHPSSAGAYRRAVLATTGLVGYWRLDDRGTTAVDSRDHDNGVITPGVTKGASGLISGEADKSILLNGKTGSVRVPAARKLDLRRAFSLEAWVTTIHVANRHIVSRVGSWFLKTDAFGRWTAGLYTHGVISTVSSRIVARGPKLPASARPRDPNDTSSSFNPLWIVLLGLLVGFGMWVSRRSRAARR